MKITPDGMSRAGKKAIWPTRRGVKTKKRKKERAGDGYTPSIYQDLQSNVFLSNPLILNQLVPNPKCAHPMG